MRTRCKCVLNGPDARKPGNNRERKCGPGWKRFRLEIFGGVRNRWLHSKRVRALIRPSTTDVTLSQLDVLSPEYPVTIENGYYCSDHSDERECAIHDRGRSMWLITENQRKKENKIQYD